MKIETVKVIREGVPGGYIFVNKSDVKPTDRVHGRPMTTIVEVKPKKRTKPDLKNCKPCAEKRKKNYE